MCGVLTQSIYSTYYLNTKSKYKNQYKVCEFSLYFIFSVPPTHTCILLCGTFWYTPVYRSGRVWRCACVKRVSKVISARPEHEFCPGLS